MSFECADTALDGGGNMRQVRSAAVRQGSRELGVIGVHAGPGEHAAQEFNALAAGFETWRGHTGTRQPLQQPLGRITRPGAPAKRAPRPGQPGRFKAPCAPGVFVSVVHGGPFRIR